MSKIKLHKATTGKQLKAVLDIINKHSNLLSEKTFNQIRDGVYYIAEKNDVPIGVLGYRPLNGSTVEQVNTVILPEFRGRGYGEEISTRLSNYLLDRYNKVFCTVNATNTPMLNIKRKQGYVVEGILKQHFGPGPGRDIFIMAKFKQ